MNLGVVELDVEIAGRPVGALYENQLEGVELVIVTIEITNVNPVDAESPVPVNSTGSISYHVWYKGRVWRSRINVSKERGNDGRTNVGGQTPRRVYPHRGIKCHITVIVDVKLGINFTKIINIEADVNQTGGLVVVCCQPSAIKSGPDDRQRISVNWLETPNNAAVDITV